MFLSFLLLRFEPSLVGWLDRIKAKDVILMLLAICVWKNWLPGPVETLVKILDDIACLLESDLASHPVIWRKRDLSQLPFLSLFLIDLVGGMLPESSRSCFSRKCCVLVRELVLHTEIGLNFRFGLIHELCSACWPPL